MRSSQLNKQKQADSSQRRIWECRGPSIQTTFHTALRKDTLHVFRVFKERINFLVRLLSQQFELHSFRFNIAIRVCRVNRLRWFWWLLEDNCNTCTPRTALAHPMILENGPKTESCDSGTVALSKHSSEQTQKIPKDPKRSQNYCCTKLRNPWALDASVMAEALHKMQKENRRLW